MAGLAVTVVASLAVGIGSASAAGAEKVPISCSAEWNPQTGATQMYVFAPDTPQIPVGVSGFEPFTGAFGVGVFTPSGRMNILCHRNKHDSDGAAFSSPPGLTWTGESSCVLYRGGQDFSTIGARVFVGTGQVVVGTDAVNINCQGKFVGISTGPTTLPGG